MIEKSIGNVKTENMALTCNASILCGKLLPFAVLGVGVVCVVKGLLTPYFDSRALILALIAALLMPLRVEIKLRQVTLPLALRHAALFAGAVTLGPYGAALPAVFCGISRLIFGPKVDVRLLDAIYLIFEPVAACAAASAVYAALGGDVFRPYGVDSIVPMLAAGLAYAAVTTLATRKRDSSRARLAGLVICLSVGCFVAALFAVASMYALIVPGVAAALAAAALREPKPKSVCREQKAAPKAVAPPEPETSVDSLTGLANERYC